ncbi:calcitonin gene-related peptide 2-like [Lethenteron reissneri]|uniref:calcitonin gene-related peptide 2-like n=1 Tax=Lethenteron reissneri TaxID=7753 RepID=UPI002AB7AD5F|nr:calcitonin gene-related peptide 2-like [Lethenteron reissneri]XP_061435090.1 calcitonin gene-related peptide 2-like [Lethenteron reissneri]XP_061435091.1 calcitonin gene-related peptide 2-like [Lethenteron reissneri]
MMSSRKAAALLLVLALLSAHVCARAYPARLSGVPMGVPMGVPQGVPVGVSQGVSQGVFVGLPERGELGARVLIGAIVRELLGLEPAGMEPQVEEQPGARLPSTPTLDKRECKASTCAIQRLVSMMSRSRASGDSPRTDVGSATYGKRRRRAA